MSKAKNRQLFGFTADRMVLQVWTVTGSATIGGDVDVSGKTKITNGNLEAGKIG